MNKVLFVATVDSHIKQFHIPYLKYFKDQGYEVHVATGEKEKIEYCDKKIVLPIERSPFKFENIKAIKQLKNEINKEQYAIIHCHTPMGGVVARLASKEAREKYNTKVIYTAHGFHFYKGAPLLNWFIYYPIEKVMASYTDCLITITQEDYEFAKKHLTVKKIEHINGIGMNTKRFEKVVSGEGKKQKRNELGISEEDLVFSYVAELNKNKNQILLINAIEQLKEKIPNVKLLLVGTGSLMEKYEEIVKDKQLEENIKFLGRRSDINEILSITNIYLASSIREGLPVNIIEAMYKELPVIATNNRGHRELVINDETGYLVHSNLKSDSMVEKIFELIGNKEKMKEYGKKAKELTEKYKDVNVLKEMERIYSSEK